MRRSISKAAVAARFALKEAEKRLSEELRAIGCPYIVGDERAKVWLEGYQACVRAEIARLRAA